MEKNKFITQSNGKKRCEREKVKNSKDSLKMRFDLFSFKSKYFFMPRASERRRRITGKMSMPWRSFRNERRQTGNSQTIRTCFVCVFCFEARERNLHFLTFSWSWIWLGYMLWFVGVLCGSSPASWGENGNFVEMFKWTWFLRTRLATQQWFLVWWRSMKQRLLEIGFDRKLSSRALTNKLRDSCWYT